LRAALQTLQVELALVVVVVAVAARPAREVMVVKTYQAAQEAQEYSIIFPDKNDHMGPEVAAQLGLLILAAATAAAETPAVEQGVLL
jgi:hypothetical protein